ncbi:hypothetical protein GCM10023310_54430 [Paenibacillus vulneris]|uniref:UDP-N-acetylglucosamine 2-epimerase n=1 Tax=Paenibacillus vulneris TaxID=1133364 RepID=A0ABW3UVT9_9BACL
MIKDNASEEEKITSAILSRIELTELHLQRMMASLLENVEQQMKSFKESIEELIEKKIEECHINQHDLIKLIDERIGQNEHEIKQVVIENTNNIQRKINHHMTLANLNEDATNKKIADISFTLNKNAYQPKEKIKVVFLFQVASFWPSWETFWEACLHDDRFDVKMVLFDHEIEEQTQMKTARAFLDKQNIEYIDYDHFNIEQYQPHILVMQTPYSHWHRPRHLWADEIKSMGIRVIYIPYGIEISDTESSRIAHFQNEVVRNCWRVYTISEPMREQYILHSQIGMQNIKAVGHPKFDKLYVSKEDYVSNEIREAAKGRKIILWKVHFPKEFEVREKGKVMVTPYLDEYLAFARKIIHYPDYLFVFCPHPKFYEMCQWLKKDRTKGIELQAILSSLENVYQYEEDDYRPALFHADYIIVDRSAVMIEAAAMKVPVLYMYNADYKEPMTDAVNHLVESYYQGTGAEDMIQFIEMCKRDEDPLKERRFEAFHKCIPFFDGLSGERIKEDIIAGLESEVII